MEVTTIQTGSGGMEALARAMNASSTLIDTTNTIHTGLVSGAVGTVDNPIILPHPQKPKDPTKNRFSDATWFNWLQDREVLLIGAGGIGSWVAMCLARIGCALTIVDNDLVELHNLGGQMFRATQVNSLKVGAVREICIELAGSGSSVSVDSSLYTEDSYTNPIVIMAVDNMKTRKLAFEKWIKLFGGLRGDSLFIDGRLLAEDYQVYAVTPDRADAYRETLFLDSEVPAEMCTLKSTTHCSLGIASDIVSVLTNFAANRATVADPEVGVETRDVPFKIVKSIPFYSYEVTFKADGNNNKLSSTGQSNGGTENGRDGSQSSRADGNTAESNLPRISQITT